MKLGVGRSNWDIIQVKLRPVIKKLKRNQCFSYHYCSYSLLLFLFLSSTNWEPALILSRPPRLHLARSCHLRRRREAHLLQRWTNCRRRRRRRRDVIGAGSNAGVSARRLSLKLQRENYKLPLFLPDKSEGKKEAIGVLWFQRWLLGLTEGINKISRSVLGVSWDYIFYKFTFIQYVYVSATSFFSKLTIVY